MTQLATTSRNDHNNPGTAIDLFAGAGGVTSGLKAAGARVVAAVELELLACSTYAANHPEVHLWNKNILDVLPQQLLRELGIQPGELSMLAACAPCQGFSTLGTKRRDDPRNDLVLRVLDFVEVIRPRTVAFENVPQLRRDERFRAFVHGLRKLGYGVWSGVIDAADFGVPQRRRRLVVLAVDGLIDESVLHLPMIGEKSVASPARVSVRDAFADLLPIDSGDRLHVSRSYPPHVQQRIRAVPKDGGSRHDLPDHLKLRCHANLGRNAGSVYGRMRWDDVAPTLTTRCTSPSCGRYLHPEEDRAITLREAAQLQTFSGDYTFVGSRLAVEAQIGNAVPAKLATAIWHLLIPNFAP